jgi:hypothetical protein
VPAELPLTQLAYYWLQMLFNDIYLPDSRNVSRNLATPIIDAGFLYGVNDTITDLLRTHSRGMLKLSDYDEIVADPVDCGALSASALCVGDPRAEDTLQMLALTTMWTMEHNRIAGKLASREMYPDDEIVFQAARRIVIALIQKITEQTLLPMIMDVPPAPRTVVGHAFAAREIVELMPLIMLSMRADRVLYSDQNQELSEIPLTQGAHNPTQMHRILGGANGACTVLTGMLRDPLLKVAPIANATFAAPCAYNYSALAQAMMISGAEDSGGGSIYEKLAREPHVEGSIMGTVTLALLRYQLLNISRDGDPNWYTRQNIHFPREGAHFLADVLNENCPFIDNLHAESEFVLWEVSDVKVIEENNANLNQANTGALIFFVVLISLMVVVFLVFLGMMVWKSGNIK